MNQLLTLISDSPIVGFTILLLVTLTLPPLFERIKLPGLVGLLVAGVLLGSDGLGLINPESEMMKLLSDAGKIYLMFVAGLEIDLKEFRKTKERSLTFGILTFIVPMIFGTVLGQFFGFSLNASVLIGSLLASHTLLGYPIVKQLGVANNESVAVTVGATILTDTAALLVLAICIAIHAGEFSPAMLIIQLGALAIYAIVVLFGFDWAGKEYFRRTGDDEGNQFLFILLVVFLAAVGAQAINIDKIVGAFLAGLAVNDVLGRGPVEEKVVFVGSTLFIPFFFIDMGLLLSVPAFISTLTAEFWFTLAVVSALIFSKFLAAFFTKLIFRYNQAELITMWSLSLPQVAATLAATVVGVNAGLLTESVFNAVIVLMLVTSLLGPILTARSARNLPLSKAGLSMPDQDWGLNPEQPVLSKHPSTLESPATSPFTVVVPIQNPYTERYLIATGALLARHESGIVIPLAIARSHVHMDEPELDTSLSQCRKLLHKALEVSSEFSATAQPVVRIDDDVAYGISRTAKEYGANLIIMGWSETTGLRARLFGNVVDSVFWSTHCPVAVMRLLDEPINIHRILVPVKNITAQALRPVRFAQLLANTNQASVTLLHVCDRQTSDEQIAQFESDLTELIAKPRLPVETHLQTLRDDNVVQAIVKLSQSYDLVVLRSIRRRTAGGLSVSDMTTQMLSELNCSMVLFGEPHYQA